MIFRKQTGVLSARFDDGLLVFDPAKNLPYTLNDVAALIFMNTDGKLGTEEIARVICEEYHVGFDQALGDVKALYGEFLKRDIVKQVG